MAGGGFTRLPRDAVLFHVVGGGFTRLSWQGSGIAPLILLDPRYFRDVLLWGTEMYYFGVLASNSFEMYYFLN